MVVEDAGRCLDAVSFTIVSRQMKSCNLRDAVRRARMKWSPFILRHLRHFSEHFTGGRKVEPATGRTVPQGGQDVVGAVDVGIKSREFVFKRIGHETLGSQVIALIRLDGMEHTVNAGKTFQRGGVQVEAILYLQDPPESVLG